MLTPGLRTVNDRPSPSYEVSKPTLPKPETNPVSLAPQTRPPALLLLLVIFALVIFAGGPKITTLSIQASVGKSVLSIELLVKVLSLNSKCKYKYFLLR